MRTARAVTDDGATAVARVEMAARLGDRLRGLLGRASLAPGAGLHIAPCPSIHTFFMRFPIDAIFLDRDNRVTRIVRNLQPFRSALGGRRAASVLEVAAGWLHPDALRPGDRLRFLPLAEEPPAIT